MNNKVKPKKNVLGFILSALLAAALAVFTFIVINY